MEICITSTDRCFVISISIILILITGEESECICHVLLFILQLTSPCMDVRDATVYVSGEWIDSSTE